MSIKRGYKVCAKLSDDRFVSSAITGIAQVTYIIGQWVKPKPNSGPLCVFDTKLKAQDYVSAYATRGKIFACEYEPVSAQEIIDDHGMYILWHYAQDNKFRGIGHNVCLPSGTRLAKRVKLIEAV